MNISNSVVLITGGATGIGLSLAKDLLQNSNTVIVCGRDESKLKKAKELLPNLVTCLCDITCKNDRENLLKFVEEKFQRLNVLINNAAIMNKINFLEDDMDADLEEKINAEIQTNFMGPILISSKFIKLLSREANAAIINISSAISLLPMPSTPIYSATKAALHSFSISLRHQLEKTNIKVFEVLPPPVDTDLSKPFDVKKLMPEAVSKSILSNVKKNKKQIHIGDTKLFYFFYKIAPNFLQSKLCEY